MREFKMPTGYDSKPSQFARQERQHENKKLMETTEGVKVIIVDYKKEEGLYVVENADGSGPLYKVSPNKLVEAKKEDDK